MTESANPEDNTQHPKKRRRRSSGQRVAKSRRSFWIAFLWALNIGQSKSRASLGGALTPRFTTRDDGLDVRVLVAALRAVIGGRSVPRS